LRKAEEKSSWDAAWAKQRALARDGHRTCKSIRDRRPAEPRAEAGNCGLPHELAARESARPEKTYTMLSTDTTKHSDLPTTTVAMTRHMTKNPKESRP
jgi:hypothetical protein